MKTTVDLYAFRRYFEDLRPNNFSYEGLAVLFEYLEEFEDSSGEELEFDVIGLCCDFAEDTVGDIARNYGLELEPGESELLSRETVREWLEDEGALVGETADGFVYRNI